MEPESRSPELAEGKRVREMRIKTERVAVNQINFSAGAGEQAWTADEAWTIGALLEYAGRLIWAECDAGRGQDVADQNYGC